MGVLICDKLYVYGFDYAKKDNKQLKWQITFTENNPEGIEFVEKFSKSGFNTKKIKTWVFEKNRFRLHVESIIEKIISPLTLTKLLNESLQKSFSKEEIDEAFNQVEFSITRKEKAAIHTTIERQLSSDTPTVVSLPQTSENITKLDAVRLFNQVGVAIPKQCSFASLNKNGRYYWVNPGVKVLQAEWWFVLNDTKKRSIYCFKVPENKYQASQFSIREDKHVIDFNFLYSKNSFIDRRSNIDFKPWLVKTISY